MNNQQLKTFCCYSIRSNVDGCMHVTCRSINRYNKKKSTAKCCVCAVWIHGDIWNSQWTIFEFKIQIYITNDTSQKKKMEYKL